MAHFRPIFNQTNQPLLLPINDPPRLLLAANQPIGCNALIPFPKNTDAIQKRIEKTPQINVGINANRKKVIDKKDIPASFLVHSYSLPIRHPNCTCDSLKALKRCSFCAFEKVYRQYLKQEKISQSVWEAFQATLAIKVEGGTFTAKQCRLLRHLLEHFTVCFPRIKDDSVTAVDIAEWIETKLPKTLKNLLPHIATPFIAEPIKESVEKKAKIEAEKQQEKKKKKKKKKQQKQQLNNIQTSTAKTRLPEKGSQLLHKRKAVSKSTFRKVINRQGLHCYWCGIKVIRESNIPVENRLLKKDWKLNYKIDGALQETMMATIDHLQRVTDAGTNDPANLVISCYPCNKAREKATQEFRSVAGNKKQSCFKCGNKFILYDQNICAVCGAEIFQGGRFRHFKLFNFNLSISLTRLPIKKTAVAKVVRKLTYHTKRLFQVMSSYDQKQKVEIKKTNCPTSAVD